MKKLLILTLILSIFLSACQPTPENLIVQNKADEELMDAITKESTETLFPTDTGNETDMQLEEKNRLLSYKTIDHVAFEDELVNGIKLESDADIIMPDAENFPVVTFRRKKLSQNEINTMIKAIIGEGNLYKRPAGGEWTKSEIADMIVNVNYEYDNLQSPMAINKGIKDLAELHKQRDEILKGLYSKMKTAPETLPLVSHSGQIEDGYIRAMAYMGETRALLDIIAQSDENSSLGINFSLFDNKGDPINSILHAVRLDGNLVSAEKSTNQDMGQEIVFGMDLELVPVDSKPEAMVMTPEEAESLAETTFINMGANENVRVSNIYYLEIPERNINCYAVELKRYVGDMPIEIIRSNNVGIEERSNDDQFNSGVPNERMSVFIADEGIIDLEWREPIEMVETLNSNVELTATDKIVDVFKQEFKNSYAYYSDGETFPYQMDQIKLNYGLARVANDNDLYMSIPLWDFYAGQRQVSQWTSFYGEHETMESYSYKSLLTINAVDGSRFSRFWGY